MSYDTAKPAADWPGGLDRRGRRSGRFAAQAAVGTAPMMPAI